MAGRLEGRVAIVTGASAGIGRATAQLFAREGARLGLSARRVERLEQVAAEARAAGSDAVVAAGDARAEETAMRTVAATLGKFGRIDILIANAGMGVYKKFVDTSLAEYEAMMDSNVRSSWLIARHTVPVMLAQKEGTVLFVSSVAGMHGYANEATYCASKFAQMGLAEALDAELRLHNIKVGTINPGGVKTEFAIGQGRTEDGVARSGMMEPEDVAQAILFACIQPAGTRQLGLVMRPMCEA
ncbi:MAG: SDR family oxidoreductase [Alphaproteobacteria bacterium]|nr:SDR family oxidoreductase [Alphaproteobacteria bacterium]